MTAKKTEKDASFEKSLERLETIVEEMESGKLGLDDLLLRFEEGQGLLKTCNRKLNEVERRIEVLIKKGEEMEAEPFANEPEGAVRKEEDGELL